MGSLDGTPPLPSIAELKHMGVSCEYPQCNDMAEQIKKICSHNIMVDHQLVNTDEDGRENYRFVVRHGKEGEAAFVLWHNNFINEPLYYRTSRWIDKVHAYQGG